MNNSATSDSELAAPASRVRGSGLAMRIRSAALQAQRAKPARAVPASAVSTPQSAAGVATARPEKKAKAESDAGNDNWSGFRRYLRGVGSTRLLTPEEEHDLAVAYTTGGDAAAGTRLVTANLRLVVKIAEEYGRPGDTLLDLIQEGNLGLVRAVQKFDPGRGVRLSSYAAWWIRAYVLKYLLSNHRMVRVGTTLAQRRLFYRLHGERDRLETAGVAAEAKHIAEALQVKETQVVEMQVRLGSSEPSLDAPISDDSPTSQLSFLADDPAARPDQQVENGEFQRRLRYSVGRFVEGLQGRERDIAERRLLADEPATLREIGLRYGVSRERARQIEANLKERMRAFLRTELGDMDLLQAAA